MIEYGIGSVRLDSRYDFGAVGASKFEDDKYGFCDTDEELQEVEKKIGKIEVWDYVDKKHFYFENNKKTYFKKD